MMGQIQDNFVAYVSHLQVARVEEAPKAPSPQRIRYSSSEDAAQGSAALRATAAAIPAEERMGEFAGAPDEVVASANGDAQAPQMPVKVEKTPGRNEPCFCGSGKKYKLCHGR
jgi:preprotein translocase subunit SecA